MSAIRITGTKNKATAKLFGQVCSFMFEQEFDETRYWSKEDKQVLRNAKEVLAKHA